MTKINQAEIPTSIIFADHSQSNRAGVPLNFEGDPSEQAFDGRALCLDGLGVLAVSSPIELAYLEYYQEILGLSLPEIITPSNPGPSLSKRLLSDEGAKARIIAAQQKLGVPLIFSVFDPTPAEAALYDDLTDRGANLVWEIDRRLAAEVGNKSGFRNWCAEHEIPQLFGGVFTNVTEAKNFIIQKVKAGDQLMIKHPNGTAGEGIMVVSSIEDVTEERIQTWSDWIEGCGSMVIEQFAPKASEHAVHIYIDPLTKKARITGIYEQLVTKGDEGFSHYGCTFSGRLDEKSRHLNQLANNKLIPALLKSGYTGPACFDVLLGPDHFMELNTRYGANAYVKEMVSKVIKARYPNTNPEDINFTFLAGLEHEANTFEEYTANGRDKVFKLREDGLIIATNPLRQAFKSYDLVAVSLDSPEHADAMMRDALTKLSGVDAAKAAFDKIYQR
jgi:hypothetical protein